MEENNLQDTGEKPIKYSLQENFPYNDLGDRKFEELLHSLAKGFISTKKFLNIEYDNAVLMSGVNEKGRDIILSSNCKTIAVIQCKKYGKNITMSVFLEELTKFILNYIDDINIIPDINNFKYILAVSKGISNDVQEFISNRAVYSKDDLEKQIKHYSKKIRKKEQKDSIINEIIDIILSLKIESLLPKDLNIYLYAQKDVLHAFFQIEKVIDQSTFEKIINDTELDKDKFIEDYGENVKNNFSRINFFGLALPRKPREVQLYSLFVEPSFEAPNSQVHYKKIQIQESSIDEKEILTNIFKGSGKSQITLEFFEKYEQLMHSLLADDRRFLMDSSKLVDDRKFHFKDIFNDSRNLIILGKPGAGKSSLVKYAMCKLFDRDDYFNNKEIYSRIPIRIELHKYNKYKMQHSSGLVEYITKILEEEFQISYVSKKALDEILKNYSTLIFFDGLDEVLDIQERTQIRHDIENIITLYPNLLSVVTSRYEAYEEVHFNGEFKVVHVLDFNPKQMEEYVNKWYSIEEDDENRRQKEIQNCLIELENIEEELKKTPLLLTLILVLYRNELELPTSKLDLYESCTNTLVEVRDDKEKKMNLILKISNKIATFSALANWQYIEQDSKGKTISYEKSCLFIKDYLINKGEFEEDNTAQQAAEEFLEFAKLRSIYVENKFTHKTFLEYFTAYYIFTTTHAKGKIEERDEIISEYIGKSSWTVILELLVCKIDQQQVDFEIIDNLIEKQIQDKDIKSVMFFLQIIKYLRNISPKMTKRIIDISIDILILTYSGNQKNEYKVINAYFIALLKIERYSFYVIERLVDLPNKISDSAIKKLYYQFALENNLEGLKINMKEITECSKEDPLVYILYNFRLIDNDDKYLELLKEFYNTFGEYNTLKTYSPSFSYNFININGRDNFNWIVEYLFFENDLKIFELKVKRLIKIGLHSKLISKSLNGYTSEIGLEKDQLLACLQEEPSEQVKRVILSALKQFYKYKPEKNVGKEPYYKDIFKKNYK